MKTETEAEPFSQNTRRDRRRRELIDTACRLLADKGFEGLRVRDVAEGAGVNIATLHYYFPDKETLIIGIVEHIVHSFIASNPLLEQNRKQTAAEQIHCIITNQEKRVRENPEFFIILTEITSRAHRSATIQTALAKMESGWRDYLTSLLVSGHADGSISKSADPAFAASLMTSVMRGTAIQMVYGLDRPDFQRIAEAIDRIIGASE